MACAAAGFNAMLCRYRLSLRLTAPATSGSRVPTMLGRRRGTGEPGTQPAKGAEIELPMSVMRIRSFADLSPELQARNRGPAAVDLAAGKAPGVPGREASTGKAQGTRSGDEAAMGGALMLPYPVGSNRVWRQAGGRVIPNAKAVAWKRTAAHLARQHGIELTTGPVEIHCTLHPRMNKDGSSSKTRLDCDAPLKSLLDALNGVAYHDDRQVVRIVAEVGGAAVDGGLSVRVMAC